MLSERGSNNAEDAEAQRTQRFCWGMVLRLDRISHEGHEGFCWGHGNQAIRRAVPLTNLCALCALCVNKNLCDFAPLRFVQIRVLAARGRGRWGAWYIRLVWMSMEYGSLARRAGTG